MPYYLCRLLPPRPSFATDMTVPEGQVMQVHGAYWRGLADQEIAVLFGPVADPQGPWGLGLLEVEDEEEAQAITAEDPAIKSGMGFRYEILPMLRAILRNSLERRS